MIAAAVTHRRARPPNGLTVTPETRLVRLSPRDIELLQHLGRGERNKEIAFEMGVTVGGSRQHTLNLFAKLGCHNRCYVGIWAFHQTFTPGMLVVRPITMDDAEKRAFLQQMFPFLCESGH